MKNYSEAIKAHAINGINDLMGQNPEASELHHKLFNEDYFIIGTYKAEQFLISEGGVFNAIGEIQDYEQSNFGEVSTDLSNAEKVANMYAYIKGEKLLNECGTVSDNWDDELTDEQLKAIISEIENA